MPSHFLVSRAASVHTQLTCNCLLPAPLATCLPSSGSKNPVAVRSETPYAFYAASYELLSGPDAPDTSSERNNDPRHVGECAIYTGCHGTAPRQQRSTTSKDGVPSMPGVFDLICVPSSFCGASHSSSGEHHDHNLLVSCTDGSVRFLHPSSLADEMAPCTDIHAKMITSCTPFYASEGRGEASPHLLWSAHTGAVGVYSVAERCITHTLEGHEFDAWCTAVLPMGGWWTKPAHLCSGDSDAEQSSNDGKQRPEGDAFTGATLLASGGDDGVCKLYDLRCSCRRAASRMQLDAGVVSLTPVLDTCCHTAAALSTPYLLVGSYDESVSLVDVRSMRRPVAQRGGLGGGVWRTSRCLRPLWDRKKDNASQVLSECTDVNVRLMLENALGHAAACDGTPMLESTSCGWVNTSNVLVLPLMQRGAALLPYDVRAASAEVFGEDPLTYFFAEEGDAATDGRPTLTKKSLIYDTAVLRPLTSDDGADDAAVVATASFYEKSIDVWTVRSARVEGAR